MILPTSELQGEVFQAKIRSRHAGCMRSTEVDALFRLRVHDGSVSSGKYKVVQGDEKERTIRRGTSLMLSNLRRLFPKDNISDEWIDLYVGMYVGKFPVNRKDEALLLDGMNVIWKYATNIAGADRKYAKHLISSKDYLISKHLLRNMFLFGALYALFVSLLLDWRLCIQSAIGTCIYCIRRKYGHA